MGYVENEKLNVINNLLNEIQYGTVLITIHDGKVTQIDRTEKVRFSIEKKKSESNKKLKAGLIKKTNNRLECSL